MNAILLSYQPPYDWGKVLAFFDGRAIGGVELIQNGEYLRTVRLGVENENEVIGWLRVVNIPTKNALKVILSDALLPFKLLIEKQIRVMFDLDCDPQTVWNVLSKMNDIKPGMCVLGTRVPGCFNPFEMAVRAVLGQQITVKAASTLANRIVQAFGKPVETEIDGLTHVFPTAFEILAMGDAIQENFGKLGVTSARSNTIRELAKVFVNNDVTFDTLEPEVEMKKLMKIKGVGVWTANYIAMRAMAWKDAFLETDYGVKCALPSYTAKELVLMAEAWRPFQSYAVLNLWNSLH